MSLPTTAHRCAYALTNPLDLGYALLSAGYGASRLTEVERDAMQIARALFEGIGNGVAMLHR